MAMYDWNHDGQNNMTDNYIEHEMYKKSTENKNTSYTPSGKGISTFGAILSTIAGILGQALIYTVLEIDIDDVPIIVMFILWIIITTVVAIIAEIIGL